MTELGKYMVIDIKVTHLELMVPEHDVESSPTMSCYSSTN